MINTFHPGKKYEQKLFFAHALLLFLATMAIAIIFLLLWNALPVAAIGQSIIVLAAVVLVLAWGDFHALTYYYSFSLDDNLILEKFLPIGKLIIPYSKIESVEKAVENIPSKSHIWVASIIRIKYNGGEAKIMCRYLPDDEIERYIDNIKRKLGNSKTSHK